MPTPRTKRKTIEHVFKTLAEYSHLTLTEACRAAGVPRQTALNYIGVAPRFGIEPPTFKRRFVSQLPTAELQATWSAPVRAEVELDKLRDAIKGTPETLEHIATRLNVTEGQALDAVNALKKSGVNIHREGDSYVIHAAVPPAYLDESAARVQTSTGNLFRFGAVADSHLGSKYERLDALNDIYDYFEKQGIAHVYHCGNWIEGEARFNRTDIHIHGMGPQLRYLAKEYPQRKGITTYAVSGDDHEGWYGQREAVDIGRLAQDEMRRAGRTDWVDLGFMEAHVRLVNEKTGVEAKLAVVHPGGGSSYAESYVVQKIIESLDGGEKPAIALYGHYHKMLTGNYRNVWWALVPSTKDQDTFMRKKRLRSVIGGGVFEAEQDPATGAILRFKSDMWQYFNKGYYNGRWNHDGPVVLPERGI